MLRFDLQNSSIPVNEPEGRTQWHAQRAKAAHVSNHRSTIAAAVCSVSNIDMFVKWSLLPIL